jgi:hypothetical protein
LSIGKQRPEKEIITLFPRCALRFSLGCPVVAPKTFGAAALSPR